MLLELKSVPINLHSSINGVRDFGVTIHRTGPHRATPDHTGPVLGRK